MNFENNIIKYDFEIDEVNEGLAELCFKSMKANKDNVAQYVAETDEVDTYGELLQRSIRCALKMKAKGLREGDIISICTHNHKNCCVPFIAGIFLGVKIASSDPVMSVEDMEHFIKEISPKTIFVSPNAIELIEKGIELAQPDHKINLVVFGASEKYEQFDEYLEPNQEENDFKPVSKSIDDTSVILFSSGTTGLPKGICMRDRSYYSLAYKFRTGNAPQPKVLLSYSNIYWSGHVTYLVTALLCGFARLFLAEFDPKKIWALIEKYKADTVFLTPYLAMDISQYEKPAEANISSVRIIVLSGAPTSTRVFLKLVELFPNVPLASYYGLTELGMGLAAFVFNREKDRELLKKNPLFLGSPFGGYWYKVADLQTGKAVGPNQEGELCIKTEYRMNGYHNHDSSNVFDDEGYMRTGDLVYYDTEGYFFMVDRIKELVKHKTLHVPPAAIELTLRKHPAVKEAIVIGIPHEEDGEHPLAIVQVNEGQENVTEEEIVNFVNERVDNPKKLRAGVKFVKEFPLTPTDKIRKYLLKKMVQEGKL